ncbi:MAG TPA: hypothetical protein HA354_05760 [Candidatus Poseidoniaceae archaeon]|nr:hypothetical protein [Euryarchaeota archaeon]DAC57244.1 MAG TPA: hypothetical protein D7I07_05745 [Candidatus Poseidoniales archaeon]HII37984.1 hypothetical protein [Candidatus Poseidoniaceae archaeon]
MVDSDLPIITLVIKSLNDEHVKTLTEENKNLINTLSMLCSFMSIGDFITFVYSSKLVNLIETKIAIEFEIGLYSNHEIILDMVVTNNSVTLTDCQDQNYLRTIECANKEELLLSLNQWIINSLNS